MRLPRKSSRSRCSLSLHRLIAIPLSFALMMAIVPFMLLRNEAKTEKTVSGLGHHLRSSVGKINSSSFTGESISDLRQRLPPMVWSMAGRNGDVAIQRAVRSNLTSEEKETAMKLCGNLLFSSLVRAVEVDDLGEQTFVATGDIDDMWTRDSAVQIGLYMGRMRSSPFLRPIIEGAIRRQAFNTLQDPYANAFEHQWVDPSKLDRRDSVIGRGGFVATRNYELDSGAYFLTQLYDYYVAHDIYRPEALLTEPLIFDAVMLMVDTWIVEQHHDEQSPYRYFELPQGGKGAPTGYTGMTWSGFRPSDDPCQYGYLIPANIYAAAALERTLELNKRIWHSEELEEKAMKLLQDIAHGIQKHGIVQTASGESIYAYEVDGNGKALVDFDDANVPSLLSIPLLGWSGYDHAVYTATRKRILSRETNKYYFAGAVLKGVGSPHTLQHFVWSMAFAVEALTVDPEEAASSIAFQIRQSLKSACDGVMHESVDSRKGCVNKSSFSRAWFEWANALFVVLVETGLGEQCDSRGRAVALNVTATAVAGNKPGGTFYNTRHKNDPENRLFYQGIEAMVRHKSSKTRP